MQLAKFVKKKNENIDRMKIADDILNGTYKSDKQKKAEKVQQSYKKITSSPKEMAKAYATIKAAQAGTKAINTINSMDVRNATNKAAKAANTTKKFLTDFDYRNEVGTKALMGAGVGMAQLTKGALKTVENWGDAARTVTDNINNWAAYKTGIIDKKEYEKQKKISEDSIKADAVGDFYKNNLGWNEENANVLKDYSYITEDNLGGQLTYGIGQQIPALMIGHTQAVQNLMTNSSLQSVAGDSALKNAARGFIRNAPMNLEIGARSYGGAVEEALQNGATMEQARRYGILNAGTEIATEWMTGGVPGVENTTGLFDKGVDAVIDKATGRLNKETSKAIAKSLLSYGFDALGEGLEESVSEIFSPLIKNMTYSNGEKIDWNSVLNAGIMGMLQGGILNAPSTVKNARSDIRQARQVDRANQEAARQQAEQQARQELNTAAQSRLNEIYQQQDQTPIFNQQNRLRELAQQQVNQIQQQVQNGQISPQEGTQQIENIQRYITAQQGNQTNQVTNETTQDNINTQEQQNVVQNANNEVENYTPEEQAIIDRMERTINILNKNTSENHPALTEKQMQEMRDYALSAIENRRNETTKNINKENIAKQSDAFNLNQEEKTTKPKNETSEETRRKGIQRFGNSGMWSSISKEQFIKNNYLPDTETKYGLTREQVGEMFDNSKTKEYKQLYNKMEELYRNEDVKKAIPLEERQYLVFDAYNKNKSYAEMEQDLINAVNEQVNKQQSSSKTETKSKKVTVPSSEKVTKTDIQYGDSNDPRIIVGRLASTAYNKTLEQFQRQVEYLTKDAEQAIEGYGGVEKLWKDSQTMSQTEIANNFGNNENVEQKQQYNEELTKDGSKRVDDHTLEYNGYYIKSAKPNVGYNYKTLENSNQFQIYDANNDDITHQVAGNIMNINDAKQWIDDVGNLKTNSQQEQTNIEQQPTQSNVETQTQQTNIPETKTEPVIRQEITGEKGKEYFMENGADEKVAQILSEKPKETKTKLREKIKDIKDDAYRLFVSNRAELERIAKVTNRPDIVFKHDKAQRYQAEANHHIAEEQTDLNYKPYNNFINENGEKVTMSLDAIRKDAKNHNISEQTLNEYLAHNLNVDRYMEDKPVFGKSVTSDDSLKRIAEIEQEHPEIKRIAQNVWAYEHNELKNTYDSGRISKEDYDRLAKYEHYVRIQRNVQKGNTNNAVLDKNGKIQINQGIQQAKGGNQDILPILETIAQRTVENTRANRLNETAKELGSAISMGSEDSTISAIEDEESFGVNPDLFKQNDDGTYTMTFFNNGKATVVPINKAIYDAFVTNKYISALENNRVFKFVTYLPKKVSSMFRTLTTNDNPMFMATNAFKDIGDAPFNSKYAKEFAEAYTSTQALREVAGNGGYNKLYNRAGGNSDSYFVDGEFKDKSQSKIGKAKDKLLTPIEKGNEVVESTPRMAEFIATIKANGYDVNSDGEMVLKDSKKAKGRTAESVLDEALYNAAEVTTNFKRGGDLAKAINRNGGTFFNASIQGFDKQVRNFKDAFTSGDKKKIIALLTKALIFGVAPTMLNDAANDDDDEYKNMQDYLKDNYYLFKGKDGNYIRIPKGRAMSVIGSAYRRTKDYASGDKDAYKGYAKFASGQVAPNNPFENNIIAPLFAVKNNKSWSGNPIVSQSMEKRPAEEQYNEKTDEFSKWLGGKLKVSPMKINYLIDQYSGGIGDVALPMITSKATSKTSNPLVQPFVSKFTTDSVYQQKSVGDFYDAMSKAETKKYSIKATKEDKVKYTYLYSQNQKMAELKKKQSEIQASKNLSQKEKYEQAREIQKEMNKLANESVKNSNNIKDHKYYATIGDNTYYLTTDSDGNDAWARDSYADSHKKSADKKGVALYDYYKEKYEKRKAKEK